MKMAEEKREPDGETLIKENDNNLINEVKL